MEHISFRKPNRVRRLSLNVGAFVLFFAIPVLAMPVDVPVPSVQAVEYQNFSNLTWGLNSLLSLLLPLVLLAFGVGTWLSNHVLKYGRYLTFLFVSTAFFALNSLIQLPLERLRAERLQLTKKVDLKPVLQWVSDQVLSSLPTFIVSVLAALFVFWIINKSSRRWWLWATSVFSVLFLSFLVAEPFTKSYTPLGYSPLEVRIAELAARSGIPRDSVVFEDCVPFDACDMAHVSGLGPTRLVLLNKGLMDAYPESWVEQTVAHESKHFAKDDNLKGWIVATIIVLFLLFSVDRICRFIIGKYSQHLGFSSLQNPAALPLAMLVLHLMFLMVLPPINLFRQHVEFEADRYGLELTRQNQVLAEMVSSWTTKSVTRVPDPGSFFMLFRSSHPSDASRIAYANSFEREANKELQKRMSEKLMQ